MKKIGRYEILGRLGQGGMSTVYKAKAPLTGRIVALKVLRPRDSIFVELVGEEKLAEFFKEEAMIMGGVSHDHVAKIIDCDEDGGVPFMVLEYFAHSLGFFIGESYRVETATRTISPELTLYYIQQTLLGLERLHFAGIIHRDIKPYNLMLTNDDRVKIIDFGLSRVRGEEKMSIPGMQVGSPYYAAPEQRKNPEKIDLRADLYSVAVMTYRMLTGQFPQDGWGDFVSDKIHPELDENWKLFLEMGLQKNPEKRYANADVMRRSLPDVERKSESVGFSSSCCSVAPPVPLRTIPVRIMYKDIKNDLGLDELMRPQRLMVTEIEQVDSELFIDVCNQLVWQCYGAGFPLNWEQAKDYVHILNSRSWKGRDTWRLPTTAELLTLIHMLPGREETRVMKYDMHWLWSSDNCTKKQAWVLDLKGGFIERLDMDGAACICAVSSNQ